VATGSKFGLARTKPKCFWDTSAPQSLRYPCATDRALYIPLRNWSIMTLLERSFFLGPRSPREESETCNRFDTSLTAWRKMAQLHLECDRGVLAHCHITSSSGTVTNASINTTGGGASSTGSKWHVLSVNTSVQFTDTLGTTAQTVTVGAPIL